jgi:hypothetical protein
VTLPQVLVPGTTTVAEFTSAVATLQSACASEQDEEQW